MINTYASKHGRPGDLMYASPPAVLAISSLEKPDTKFSSSGTYSLGLDLPDADLRDTVRVMRETFRAAYPEARGTLKLPVRQDKRGAWLVFAETPRPPVILDEKDQPVPPPPVGALVRLLARICPYHRPDHGRMGVALYANKIKIVPAAPISATTEDPP